MIPSGLRGIRDRLEARLPAFLEELEQLVSIDSGTFDKAGVDTVGAHLQQRYVDLGAEVEIHSHDLFGDTLVARLAGAGVGRILLIGHTDTVYPAGTVAARPFRIENGRAMGPGSADMKAGDLAILYALSALREVDPHVLGRITVVHNSDEEIGSPSSRGLIEALSREADAVLVLEAGRENGDIVSARKGIADVELDVTGVAAHAGVNHRRGRSAVLELSHLVTRLEALNGTIPGVTLNVGRIEGGTRPNVVADHAYGRLEIRASQRERLVEAIERVEEIVGQRTVPDTAAACRVSISHWPMQRSDESARLVRLAQELAHELGFDVRDTATGGASDGNTAAQAGRPVLDGLGPVGGGAHSPGEYVAVDSIVPRVALLAGLIRALSDGMPA